MPGTRLVGPRTTWGTFTCWHCDGYLHRSCKMSIHCVCVIEIYHLVLKSGWFPDILDWLVFRKVYRLSETVIVFLVRWKDKEVSIDLRSNNCVQRQMWWTENEYVEIKCQLDATEVFITDLVACSTCFGHHYALHQELKSIIRWLLPVVFRAVVFK